MGNAGTAGSAAIESAMAIGTSRSGASLGTAEATATGTADIPVHGQGESVESVLCGGIYWGVTEFN